MTSSGPDATTTKSMTTRLPTWVYFLPPSWLLLGACLEPVPGAKGSADDEVGGLDAGETTNPTETMDTETSETMSTETETGPEPCVDNQDCMDPGASFCDDLSGECVACDGVMDPDAACAEIDPLAPLCSEGSCVQCTVDDDLACGDLTPICDVDANTCIGCSEHEQCPDSACNIAEGNCFDPDSTVYVDGNNSDCDTADGSEENGYCTISEALLNGGASPFVRVYARDGNASYQESAALTSATAIFSIPGEYPTLQGFNGAPAISVSGDGALYLREVIVSASPAEGVLVNGAQAWIEKSRIVNNSGGGIVVDGGGSLVLDNSFVGSIDINDSRVIDIVEGTVDINYTTIVAGFGDATALFCTDGQGSAVRNSIIISRSDADELVCPDLSVASSALEMPLGDNTELGPMDITWFSEDFAAGDFSLSGAHPLAIDIAATWLDGDPDTDINGDARPTTNGMPDFAGADRIP